MKQRMFDQLLQSVKEGGAILRGEDKAARRSVVGSPEVRAIREKTSLSQTEFARLIGVSVKTLQNWEQDRRRPTGPATGPGSRCPPSESSPQRPPNRHRLDR